MELFEVYKRLLRKFGKQGWWPLYSRAGRKGFDERGYHPRDYSYPRTKAQKFEVVAGAILAQNTNWRNAEKAILNLRNANMLDAKKIAHVSRKRVEKLVMPSGFYRQKAERLKSIAKWFISADLKMPKKEMREELLAINGVGKETADSILLYAFHKPVFVVDAYTKRMCERHGLVKGKDYESYRSFFEKNLPKDARVYNEFHALIVELGKRNCRKRPACKGCLLREVTLR